MNDTYKDMAEFISRLVSGDQGTWDEFVERFSKLIYKIFNNPGFRFSRDEIEDLYQDFHLDISNKDYRKIRLYEGRNQCKFPSYLRTIATRMAIDRRKKLNKEKMIQLNGQVDGSEKNELVDLVPADTEQPLEQIMAEDERRRYLWGLFQMDVPKCLVVLLITYHETMKRERIAELLDTTRENIDVIYKRTKDSLRELVKKAGQPAPPAENPAEWDEEILLHRDLIGVLDPSLIMDRAVRCLEKPGEFLIGLIFIDAAILDPKPKDLATLFKSDQDSIIGKVRAVLGKLAKI